DSDPRHLERVTSFVKRKVDELAAQSTAPVQKLAILAAINIAEDYLRAIDDSREFRREVAAKSKALLNELEG
ncbi:MAG: cell division protein ZapA, partial [Myxococcota bacterium]